ncbi:hypothetical protein OAO19_02950 [Gammaproteobacteria bacterium]|nr:hypothetical protein [Gammaproteobacteria bacterium]
MKLPLFGQTGAERFDDASYQKTQNWYPHVNQEAKSKLMLYPTPALVEEVSTGTAGTIRGMIEYGGKLYVVSANEFYRIESTGAKVLLGTLTTSSGRVSMAHNGASNGKQIMIVDGTAMWKYKPDDGTPFEQVTQFNDASTAIFTATHIAFMDGFFIANDTSTTGQFYKSAGYDGTDWDTLDFATAERSPDDLEALIVANRNLYLVGHHTTEQWYNSGTGTFPFAPMQQGFTQYGTVAPWSVIEVAGTLFFLSQNDEGVGQVIMMNGVTPTLISTSSIAAEISKLTSLSDAYAWTYQYQQHTFYVLTFPTDGRTFVYDLSTQAWHEWSVKSTGYHRGSHHVYVYGKHYIGDNAGNKVYSLDWDTYTDDGEAIQRIRRSANVINEDGSTKMRHWAVRIDIKEGVENADCTDPMLKLRWRDDNGAWSSYYSRSMGKIGETSQRLIWRRLGRSGDRVYEISTQDPVACVLIDSFIEVTPDNGEI